MKVLTIYTFFFFQGWYETRFYSYLGMYLSFCTNRHLAWQLSLLKLVYLNEIIQYVLRKNKTAYNQMIERVAGLEENF